MSTANHDDDALTLDPMRAEIGPSYGEGRQRISSMTRTQIRAELEAMIARRRSSDAQIEDSDEVDEYYRLLAEQITPTRAQLDVLIDRCGPSDINYDEEDDELPC